MASNYKDITEINAGSIIDNLLNTTDNFVIGKIKSSVWKQEKSKGDNKWKGRLAVTNLKSKTCCPKEAYKEKRYGKMRQFATKSVLKMNIGKAIHTAYQEAVCNVPHFKWVKPYNVPEIMKDPKLSWGDGRTLDDVWPEVATALIHNNKIYIIGMIDDVVDYYGQPIFLDYKTVNTDPIAFVNKFEKQYPEAPHVFQLKFYMYLEHRNRMYAPFKVTKGRLIYINTRMEAGDDKYEREVEVTLTEEDIAVYDELCAELIRQMDTIDEDLPCEYQWCRTHGKGIVSTESEGLSAPDQED